MNERLPIAIGVCGSIAAWKVCALHTLIRDQLDVTFVMTESATKFIGEQTFLALSSNPVVSSIWEPTFSKPKHIDLADRIKGLLIAPATANFLAKFVAGIADDALTTLAISVLPSEIPVMVAPAMNTRMWNHPATQRNLQTLQSWGVHIIAPGSGQLACGWEGEGRLAEPPQIAERLLKELKLA